MIQITEKQLSILRKLLTPEALSTLSSRERQALQSLLNDNHDDHDDYVYQLYVDGAANLAKKAAGIGGHIQKNGQELYHFSDYVENATNNEAEYLALIRGIELALELNLSRLQIYADSELVVRQINGEYKVKHPNMIPLHKRVNALLQKLESWRVAHVPREQNQRADQLSKQGLKQGPSK